MNTAVRIDHMHVGATPIVLIGAGLLGIVLLIGLLSLLANRRTRGPVLGLLLVLGFMAVVGWFHVRTRQEREGHDAARQATEARLRQQPVPSPPAGDDVTVVLHPPDRTAAGEAGDEGISVQIQQNGAEGKGTIVYVKANRALEALGKALLDTIRQHTVDQPAEPRQDAGQAKKSAATPSPKAPRAQGSTAGSVPPSRAKSPSPPERASPPSSGAYEESVTAYGKTQAECAANLDDELQKAFSSYVQRRLGTEDAGEVRFPAREIRRFIVRSSQDERESGTLGPILRTTAVVDFERAYQTYGLSQRLWHLGGGVGGVLLVLSLAYGYLKIDLATRGAYRWRLRLAAVAILCGVAAAAAVFLR